MSFSLVLSRSKVWTTNTKLFKVLINNYKSDNHYIHSQQIRRLSSERRYSDKHEWLSLDSSQTIGTVGISKYAEEALGDVVYVQLPDVDNQFERDAEVGAVESVKAASEIFTPVSGRITQINDKLEDKPGLVNSSCYEDGWLFKIELSKKEELNGLMDENSYQKFLKSIKEE